MASALASPPPPWSFGASDLKRNARAYLERALVISAILHLVAVGAFRAAYQRMIPKEEVVALVPRWNDSTFITRVIPIDGWQPASTPATKGVFDPKPDDFQFLKTTREIGISSEPVGWEREPGPSGPPSIPKNPGPPLMEQEFKVAEILPVPISAPLPRYPDFAKEVGIEGKVIVRALVGVDGYPKQVTAISGPKVLFDAAVEGVRHWKFKPGMTSGQPVEVWVEVPVVFRLGS